jgi:SAM-dependent methyltransferase
MCESVKATMKQTTAGALREAVRQAYSAIAERPQHDPPFPTGRQLALDLGYPPELLEELPAVAVEAFCGVSNVPLFAQIPAGATVLDLGCGAGMDTVIAARRTGPRGSVVGVDFSDAMLQRARRAVADAGAGQVALLAAAAELLPLATARIDLALVNGIFNLNPLRACILAELARVVRPGGAVYVGELVLTAPLSAEERAGATNWFS